MKRKDDTLKASLLHIAREVARSDGIEGISIREIARRAGIASGTVYNYFASKDAILLALTEEYWIETIDTMRTEIRPGPFVDQLQQIYRFLAQSIKTSGGMLMAGLNSADPQVQAQMRAMQERLVDALVSRMDQDDAIRAGVWNDHFTKARYARFVLMNLVMLLRMKAPDMGILLEIVKRTLYE